ncbi:MAG: ATPase, partial [Kineothrix sp.]|nr:ATPase [Kineothrix sp.]
MDIKRLVEEGKTALGIELGSTRIKGVLIDFKGQVLAVGIHDWENSFVDNIWTYSLEEIHTGIRKCYSSLREAVKKEYGVSLKKVGSIGISAMMHGYMALDEEGKQIAPFQTWRNTNTQKAADELTDMFHFNIPLRWSVAHLYQRILDREEHVEKLDYVATLSAYIHWKLTGERVIGVGDAAGMFPIDSDALDYDQDMVEKLDDLLMPYGYSWKMRDIFPKVLVAGESAGTLTTEGAAFLDESGDLEAGIPLCPPEGDAGTGMTATNSVAPRTG